jgi:hypothetical protein
MVFSKDLKPLTAKNTKIPQKNEATKIFNTLFSDFAFEIEVIIYFIISLDSFAINPKTERDVVKSDFILFIDAMKTCENDKMQEVQLESVIPTFTELNGLNSTWLLKLKTKAMKFFAIRRINQWRLLSIS